MKEKTKRGLKKALTITGDVLLVFLIIFDVLVMISKFSMRSEEGHLSLFGTETRLVLTGSMDGSDEFYETDPIGKNAEIKRIKQYSAIFVKKVPEQKKKEERQNFFASIKEGDILTFYYLGVTVTHRVIGVNEIVLTNEEAIKANNGYTIAYHYLLRGDDPSGDKVVSPFSPTQDAYSDRTLPGEEGYVYGKVTGQSKFFGGILHALMENKVVLTFVVIVPCALIALYEIGKVIFLIAKSKKEQELIEMQNEKEQIMDEKEKELARLKEELERLKAGTASTPEENDKK